MPSRDERKLIELVEQAMIHTGLMLGMVQTRDCPHPPPFDRDAEEIIAGQAIAGRLPPEWFDPIWCRVSVCAVVVTSMRILSASEQMPSGQDDYPIDYLATSLTAAGFPGELLRQDLENLSRQRWYASVEPQCRTVRSLYYRREALRRVAVLDALLRTPETPPSELEEQARRIMSLLEAAG